MSELSRRKKRISQQLPLVLVSGATLLSLSACGGNEKQIAADRYANLEDCKQDWGDSNQCKEEPNASSSGSSMYRSYYHGPYYNVGERLDAQRRLGVRPTAGNFSDRSIGRNFSSSSRGGFGSTGRGFSGGG